MNTKTSSDSFGSFVKEFVVLGMPIALQNLITLVLNLADNVMVGSLGEAVISAVTVSTTFLWLSMTAIMSMASGSSILCAQAWGRKDKATIKKTTAFTLCVNMAIAIIFFVLMSAFSSQIITLYSNIDGILAPAMTYFSIMKWSLPMMAVSTTLANCLQSVRNVKFGFFNTVGSTLINVLFNYLLIFGHFGFPQLGVAGAAIATLISRFVEVTIIFIYVFFVEKNLGFRLSDFDPKLGWIQIRSVLKVTFPILLMEISNNLVVSAQTMITGHVSNYYISANSIVHNAWTIPNAFCFGLGAAASIMIGNTIGEGDRRKCDLMARRFVPVTLVLGVLASFGLRILLPIIRSFYDIQPVTEDLVFKMGNIAAITVMFISLRYVTCNGIIRASGKTFQILIGDVLSSWVIAVPVGYLCAFVFHLPAQYLYFILRLGNVTMALWGVWMVLSGRWLKKGKREKENEQQSESAALSELAAQE